MGHYHSDMCCKKCVKWLLLHATPSDKIQAALSVWGMENE